MWHQVQVPSSVHSSKQRAIYPPGPPLSSKGTRLHQLRLVPSLPTALLRKQGCEAERTLSSDACMASFYFPADWQSPHICFITLGCPSFHALCTPCWKWQCLSWKRKKFSPRAVQWEVNALASSSVILATAFLHILQQYKKKSFSPQRYDPKTSKN